MQAAMDELFDTNRYDETPGDWRNMPETEPPDDDEMEFNDSEMWVEKLAKYNEDQPRDSHGRFGEGGDNSDKSDVTFDHADQKISSITSEEKYSFENYFDDSSMNNSLRVNNGDVSKLRASEKEDVKNMDAVIGRAVPLSENTVAYRGIRDDAGGLAEKLQSGAMLKDAGFQSWTESVGVAKDFSEDGGIRLSTTFMNGSQVLKVGGDQKEIITMRNQYIQLDHISSDGVYHVKVYGDE